jgi:RNA polymerase sigma-70 factor (ECF subfamily)
VQPESTQRSDFELLESWAEGDNGAGAMLFERYVETLQRFFAVRVPHASDDLVQATFLACVEGRERMRERRSFRAYLLGIARNQLYAFYRRQHTEREKGRFNTTSKYQPGNSPCTIAVKRKDDDVLLSALSKLPVSMQLILQLAYWDDLSASELAEALEIPVNAVHNRLHRAKQRLREALEAFEAST